MPDGRGAAAPADRYPGSAPLGPVASARARAGPGVAWGRRRAGSGDRSEVVQLAERWPLEPDVGGSSPPLGADTPLEAPKPDARSERRRFATWTWGRFDSVSRRGSRMTHTEAPPETRPAVYADSALPRGRGRHPHSSTRPARRKQTLVSSLLIGLVLAVLAWPSSTAPAASKRIRLGSTMPANPAVPACKKLRRVGP